VTSFEEIKTEKWGETREKTKKEKKTNNCENLMKINIHSQNLI